MAKITKLHKIKFNDRWNMTYQTETKQRFFAEYLGDIMFESRLMLITCGLIFLKLKKRYSVLLGLADNLLVTNQEKTSLMQDSIIDKVDEACSGENEIYIWVSFT